MYIPFGIGARALRHIMHTYLREVSASVARSNRDGQCEGFSEWERAASMALTLFYKPYYLSKSRESDGNCNIIMKFYYPLGVLALMAILAGIVFSGVADFTTPLLDSMTKLLNANSSIRTSEHSLNNTGFWTGFYLQLVIDTWLFSSNWWIVLLSAAVLVACAIWVANLLLDNETMSDMFDNLCGAFELKPNSGFRMAAFYIRDDRRLSELLD